MKNKLSYLLGVLVIAIFLGGLLASHVLQQTPENVCIPHESTAKKVAEAILIPIYGQEQIEAEKPFKVKLISDSVWVVEGTQKEVGLGGVFYIEIQKKIARYWWFRMENEPNLPQWYVYA